MKILFTTKKIRKLILRLNLYKNHKTMINKNNNKLMTK